MPAGQEKDSFFESLVLRAKVALDVTSDKQLAELLGMTPTAFSNRRKSGSPPYERLIEALASRDVDFRWVFTGASQSQSAPDDKEVVITISIKNAV
jgi:transcriptional regulator with XRE-family HTH domain